MSGKKSQDKKKGQVQERPKDLLDLTPKGKEGPGVKAAQGLMAEAVDQAPKYAQLIREYPGEKAAILEAISVSALGNSFAEKVAKEAEGWEVSKEQKRLSFTSDESSNYFVADQKRKGAEFQIGDTHGTINKDGLTTESPTKDGASIETNLNYKDDKAIGRVDRVDGDTRYGVGGNVSKDGKTYGADVHGEKAVADGIGSASVGLERSGDKTYGTLGLGYKEDGQSYSLDSRYADTENYGLGVKGKRGVDALGLTEIRGGAGYGKKDGVGTVTSNAGVTLDGGHTLDLGGRYSDAENLGVNLDATRKLGGKKSLYGGLGYDVDAGVDTVSGKLGYKTSKTKTELSGAYTDSANYNLGLNYNNKINSATSLEANLGHKRTDGLDLTSAGLKSEYVTESSVLGGSLGASYDKDGLGYSANADALTTLKQGSLYGIGFGGLKGGGALDEPTYHIGGGLVLTPNEKMSLTLSGAMDQNGGFDTRLQYDLFKKKVYNAKGLSEQTKKGALSVFIGYRDGMDRDVMNDRFGGGMMGQESGQVYAGIGIRF